MRCCNWIDPWKQGLALHPLPDPVQFYWCVGRRSKGLHGWIENDIPGGAHIKKLKQIDRAGRCPGRYVWRCSPILAKQLGRPGDLLRFSSRNPPVDLYNQHGGRVPSTIAKGDQKQELIPHRAIGPKATLSGNHGYHKKMDNPHPKLGFDPQSASHPFWRSVACKMRHYLHKIPGNFTP